MKKLLLPIAFVISANAFAQNIGINSTGAAAVTSAALDVDMANKGILIPRVALTTTAAFAPVTGAATTSLMVYNTATASAGATAVTPGYYYWDGAQWVRLIGGSDSYWRVGVSAADVNQNAGTRFLGTTTNQHMDYVTNGIVRGRFSNLGEFFVGTTATALVGDLMNGVSNATFPWAVNGYSAFNGSGVYGSVTGGATVFGGVQGEYYGTNATGAGVRGISANSSIGIHGQEISFVGWAVRGDGDIGTTGNFFIISDGRLKKNIEPLQNSLSKIMSLNPVSFDYKTDEFKSFSLSPRHQVGFIAQDLENIIPEAVAEKTIYDSNVSRTTSDDSKTEPMQIKTVNIDAVVPVLVEAMQEQQVIIESQQKTIETLEQRLIALEKKFLELNK